MITEYTEIASINEIPRLIADEISTPDRHINNIFTYEIEIERLIEHAIEDKTQAAEQWGDPVCPDNLYINHGSHIGSGMSYLVDQLRTKPTGNRAIISLISQNHISNSGDTPIPSFMIFQTTIIDETLYCTTYFRALEVSDFLKINIEEIRQKITRIYEEMHTFKRVRITIFAFNAYNNPDQSALLRPRLDLLSSLQIARMLEKNDPILKDLIREKAKAHTVYEPSTLSPLLEATSEDTYTNTEKKLINRLIMTAIGLTKSLSEGRKRHSHSDVLSRQSIALSDTLNQIAGKL